MVYYWTLVIFIGCYLTVTAYDSSSNDCKLEPKCFIGKTHGMRSADCFQKNLRWFPQCLTTSVEIIDLSENRLRKVSINDLRRYSSLKMLYMSDNMIQSIDENAFDDVDLTTLDLSLNALAVIPTGVFSMPSLKSLYLSQNVNINLAKIVEEAKPITSPLQHLDISYIYQEANVLPDLGVLPSLIKYNISGNTISSLSAFHFAGLCNLNNLDTTNLTVLHTNPCECSLINKWLKERNITFKPFSCDMHTSDGHANECVGDSENMVDISNLKIYSKCKLLSAGVKRMQRSTKIIIAFSAVLVVLLTLGAILYYTRKRKRKYKQKRNNVRMQKSQETNEMLSNAIET